MKYHWACLFTFLLPASWGSESVVLYGDEAYPPYSYVENGVSKGIYVDFLRQVAKAMPDFDVQLQPVAWKRGLQMMKSGEAQALFPPYIINERDYLKPYSTALYTERIVLMCHPAVMNQPRVNFPADFAQLNIGINRGFALNEEFQKAARARQIRLDEANNNDANVRKLAARRIDCYANDQAAIRYTLRKLQRDGKASAEIKALRLVETVTISQSTAHIGFSAQHAAPNQAQLVQQLDATINELKRQGVMKQIIAQYIE